MVINTPQTVVRDWATVLGAQVDIGAEVTGRDLWPVIAADGAHYMLKRLGPWRNLPLADEARVLRHLGTRGIAVAEFIPTDRATLYAGEIEESFVLMPRLPSDRFAPAEIVSLEETIGVSMATLHLALASYPWPANSYVENLGGSLLRDLTLPPDLEREFGALRQDMVAAIAALPVQLVHGDMTPDNVLLAKPGIVAGFIDFDHLPLAPRLWDIAKYLSRRIRVRWQHEVPVSDRVRLAHLPAFMTGYDRADRLQNDEIDALPLMIAAANVLEASYFQEISAGSIVRRRLPDHDEVLADTVDALRWHLANFDLVMAAVQSSLS